MQTARSDLWSDTIDTAPQRQPPSGRRPPRARILLAAVVVVVTVVWLAGSVLMGDRVPPGTQVAGLDIGGMSPDQATTQLRQALARRAALPLTLTCRGRTFALDPRETGLSYDVSQTVDAAADTAPWDPLRFARSLVGQGERVQVVVHVDEVALAAAVARIAQRVDTEVSEGAVQVRSGRPMITWPIAGLTVDQPAMMEAVAAAYLHTGRVSIPVQEHRPSVSARRLRSFVASGLTAVLSAPIRTRVHHHLLTVEPPELAPALSYAVRAGQLVPSIDPEVLARSVGPEAKASPASVARAVLAVVRNPSWRTIVHGSSVTRFAHR